MSIEEKTIFDKALALAPELRENLAEALWESLGDTSRKDIQAAWMKEIEERIQAYEKGSIKAIPGDQVMESIRREILKK